MFAFRLYLNRKLFYIYLISLLTHDSCLNSCLSWNILYFMHFNSLDVTKGIVERKQVDWFLSDWKQGLHSSHYLSHFPLHGRPEGKYEGPNSNNGVKADLGDGVHGPKEVLDKKVEVLTSHCSHTELWNGFWKPEHNL